MNINIDIPDEVRIYVEAQVMAATYSSIGEYFLDLVQQDQKRSMVHDNPQDWLRQLQLL